MAAASPDRPDVAARRAKVLQLRAAGVTFERIAAECGHKTPAAAAQDFTRALSDRKLIEAGHVDLYLALELERLDALERQVQETLAEVAADGDHLMVLRAVDRLLRVSGHRANLLRLTHANPGARPDDVPEDRPDDVASLAAFRSRRRAKAARSR